jgi:Domain of unknown function (DUF1707)
MMGVTRHRERGAPPAPRPRRSNQKGTVVVILTGHGQEGLSGKWPRKPRYDSAVQALGPSPRGRLISDEQRDQASALLRDQYGAGRLTLEDLSARIDKVLAARDTDQLAVAFTGLEAPAWLAPPSPSPLLSPLRPSPSWVTAVTGLGAGLAAAELVSFVAETVLDQKNREGGIIVDTIVGVTLVLQSVAWMGLARRREWAPVFALVTSALLTLVTFGVGLLVAVPVWLGVLRRNRAS